MESREQNKCLKLQVETLRQKLNDAVADIKVIRSRNQANLEKSSKSQNTRDEDEENAPRREQMIEQLETLNVKVIIQKNHGRLPPRKFIPAFLLEFWVLRKTPLQGYSTRVNNFSVLFWGEIGWYLSRKSRFSDLQCSQLQNDLQTVLDEKQEVEMERDAFKCKAHRLNHELSKALCASEPLDVDALVTENRRVSDFGFLL